MIEKGDIQSVMDWTNLDEDEFSEKFDAKNREKYTQVVLFYFIVFNLLSSLLLSSISFFPLFLSSTLSSLSFFPPSSSLPPLFLPFSLSSFTRSM